MRGVGPAKEKECAEGPGPAVLVLPGAAAWASGVGLAAAGGRGVALAAAPPPLLAAALASSLLLRADELVGGGEGGGGGEVPGRMASAAAANAAWSRAECRLGDKRGSIVRWATGPDAGLSPHLGGGAMMRGWIPLPGGGPPLRGGGGGGGL